MTTVRLVPLSEINNIWEGVESWLSPAISNTDAEYKLDDIKRFVVYGAWDLYIAEDNSGNIIGATTLAYNRFNLEYVAIITAIGGKLITKTETFDKFKDLVFASGVTRLQGIVSDSLSRLVKKIGFSKKAILVELRP